MKELELLIALIREAVDDDPAATKRTERIRLAQQDRDARAVLAWAAPRFLEPAQ